MLTLDTNNSCRTCMIGGTKLISIFSKHNDRQISELVTEISGVKIDEKDSLSKKICEDCRTKVINFFAFRQLCIDTDDTVRYNILLSEQTESLELDEQVLLNNEESAMAECEEECYIEEDVAVHDDEEYMEVLVDDESQDKGTETVILEQTTATVGSNENTVIIERKYSKSNNKLNYTFDSSDELTQKMKEAHFAKEQMKKHKCPFCPKTFLFPSKGN